MFLSQLGWNSPPQWSTDASAKKKKPALNNSSYPPGVFVQRPSGRLRKVLREKPAEQQVAVVDLLQEKKNTIRDSIVIFQEVSSLHNCALIPLAEMLEIEAFFKC